MEEEERRFLSSTLFLYPYTETMDRLWILTLALGLAACGSDPVAPTGSTNNTNANAIQLEAGDVRWASEGGIGLTAAASRMEMPRLRGGADNLFVVHIVPTYGVNYAIEYDCTKRASRWTAYRWDKDFNHSGSNWHRNQWYGAYWNGTTWNGDPFLPDPLIPEAYQTTLADHRSNGHDRGHMLGSADRLNSMEANGQTFYLSNIHPQLNSFNAQGVWYTLEDRLRRQYDTDSFRDTLYIVKGGTIDTHYTMVSGRGRALVCPTYFFMALLCKNHQASQGGYKAIAFWMEHKANTDTNVAAYAISVDALEEKTGIDFFCNLPDDLEAQVERNLVPTAWGLK